jgi:hypothetical protein
MPMPVQVRRMMARQREGKEREEASARVNVGMEQRHEGRRGGGG